MQTHPNEHFKGIRLLLLDVDGVLTTGHIVYDDLGREIKSFNVKDGLGIRLLIESGIAVAIVTARSSPALIRRCRDLSLEHIYHGIRDKAGLLAEILDQTGRTARETAFIGDDLPDLALMKKVGLSIAVADAHEAVREQADWVTPANGGCGAVRQVCDLILKNNGLWDGILKRFG